MSVDLERLGSIPRQIIAAKDGSGFRSIYPNGLNGNSDHPTNSDIEYRYRIEPEIIGELAAAGFSYTGVEFQPAYHFTPGGQRGGALASVFFLPGLAMLMTTNKPITYLDEIAKHYLAISNDQGWHFNAADPHQSLGARRALDKAIKMQMGNGSYVKSEREMLPVLLLENEAQQLAYVTRAHVVVSTAGIVQPQIIDQQHAAATLKTVFTRLAAAWTGEPVI